MDICVIFDKDTDLMTSIEYRGNLPEDQTEFVSSFNTNENFFHVFNVSCTKAVFDAVAPKAGTLQAPALIANAQAVQVPDRINCYVENGSLEIAS